MSRHSKAGGKTKADVALLSSRFLTGLTGIYLFLLFVISPLYYERGYDNIGDAKWHFFRMVTLYARTLYFTVPTFASIALAGFLWFAVEMQKRDALRGFIPGKARPTDICVLLYGILTGLSCVLTPYREYIPDGFPTWYMGLWVQLSLVVIYFAVSYFWRFDRLAFTLYMASSAAVMALGLLNRFSVDPLGMYTGDAAIKRDYLSTIGQLTMYSGYVMTVFPIGAYLYWSTGDKRIRRASALYLVIGFMSIITQNADSAFLGLTGMFAVLFWFSFKENERMKRFLEIVLIMLLSWRAAGLLQMLFPDKAVMMGSLMKLGSQGIWMWPVIIAAAAFYLLLCRRMKRDAAFNVSSYRNVRNAVTAALPAMVLLMSVYIALNTVGLLPDIISFGREAKRAESYLIFNDYWGNHRGITWAVTFKTMLHTLTEDPLRFIFGAGPDEFYEVVYHYCADELNAYFGDRQVVCAHNEWLTQLVNEGLLGGAAYLFIFISSFVLSAKNSREHPELIAVMMCISSYFLHNMFCYQRITCTPFIFVILAAGVNITRDSGLRKIR